MSVAPSTSSMISCSSNAADKIHAIECMFSSVVEEFSTKENDLQTRERKLEREERKLKARQSELMEKEQQIKTERRWINNMRYELLVKEKNQMKRNSEKEEELKKTVAEFHDSMDKSIKDKQEEMNGKHASLLHDEKRHQALRIALDQQESNIGKKSSEMDNWIKEIEKAINERWDQSVLLLEEKKNALEAEFRKVIQCQTDRIQGSKNDLNVALENLDLKKDTEFKLEAQNQQFKELLKNLENMENYEAEKENEDNNTSLNSFSSQDYRSQIGLPCSASSPKSVKGKRYNSSPKVKKQAQKAETLKKYGKAELRRDLRLKKAPETSGPVPPEELETSDSCAPGYYSDSPDGW